MSGVFHVKLQANIDLYSPVLQEAHQKKKGFNTSEVIPSYIHRLIANFFPIRKFVLLFGRIFGLKLVSIAHKTYDAIPRGAAMNVAVFFGMF